MININVFSNERAWSKRLKKKELFFNTICNAFPKKYKFLNKKISLTLLLSNNRSIKKLNKNFRNKNNPTDILSFPFNKSALALYDWAPVASELKTIDRKIVLNSMILKWDNIKDEFAKLIKI